MAQLFGKLPRWGNKKIKAYSNMTCEKIAWKSLEKTSFGMGNISKTLQKTGLNTFFGGGIFSAFLHFKGLCTTTWINNSPWGKGTVYAHISNFCFPLRGFFFGKIGLARRRSRRRSRRRRRRFPPLYRQRCLRNWFSPSPSSFLFCHNFPSNYSLPSAPLPFSWLSRCNFCSVISCSVAKIE